MPIVDPQILFYSEDGLDVRAGHIRSSAQSIGRFADARILHDDPAELVEEILADAAVEIPALDRGRISFERKEITEWQDDLYAGRRQRTRTALLFDVPYSGGSQIFHLRPSSFDYAPPRAIVMQDRLRFVIADSADAQAVKQSLEAELDLVDQYLAWHREMWAGYELEIRREATVLIEARRSVLRNQTRTDANLADLGFQRRA